MEDEYFLAAEIEDILVEAGADVIGPLGGFDEALKQVTGDGFDLAILDINLGGSLSYPIADALAEQDVPFLFASAYAPLEIPARFQARRLLEKPYNAAALLKAVVGLTVRSDGDHQRGQAAST